MEQFSSQPEGEPVMISILLQYKNPSDLIDGSIYYGGPVITAQRSMAVELRKNGCRAFDINSILEALLPDWYSSVRRLDQFLAVCVLADAFGKKDSLAQAFRNNKSDVLKNFRTLAEIGITPDQMPSSDQIEMKAFSNMYQEFWVHPGSGCAALQEKLEHWQNADMFRDLLAGTTVDDLAGTVGSPEAVYFQGFHYVRPMQGRLMDAFSCLGIPVYMMAAHDPDDPPANEVWEMNHRFSGLEARAAAQSRKGPVQEPPAPKVL